MPISARTNVAKDAESAATMSPIRTASERNSTPTRRKTSERGDAETAEIGGELAPDVLGDIGNAGHVEREAGAV